MLLGLTAAGAFAASYVVGCGGGSSTAQSTGSTGTGGSTHTTTSGMSNGGATSSATTSASSSTGTSATCGDGVIDGPEQCDDGNRLDLDGCDSNCNYEVVTRMTAVAIANSAAPPALGCMPATNALGTLAISALALGQLNGTLGMDVTNGTVNVMTQLLGLTDLAGVNSQPFSIGVMDAVPDPAKGAPMNNPIDWWLLADHSTVSMGLPTGVFKNVTLKNGNFSGGPSNVSLTLDLAGSPALLTLMNAHIAGSVNATPPPNAPAPPPAKLASGLKVFQTITANGADQGLCGDITVASLAAIPLPQALTSGAIACNEKYTYCTAPETPMSAGSTCNSLLDALIGGCHVTALNIAAINPTQPDVPGGSTLTVGANKKVNVTAANGNDAYSAYLTFSANRAHLTGETCLVTSDCQTGKMCVGAMGTTAGACM
jgi:cysteine-rich repeat protein